MWMREAVIQGARWQWTGKPIHNDRAVLLLSGYQVKVSGRGKWTYFPAIELECAKDQAPEDRFNQFVDNFLQHAKETA